MTSSVTDRLEPIVPSELEIHIARAMADEPARARPRPVASFGAKGRLVRLAGTVRRRRVAPADQR